MDTSVFQTYMAGYTGHIPKVQREEIINHHHHHQLRYAHNKQEKLYVHHQEFHQMLIEKVMLFILIIFLKQFVFTVRSSTLMNLL